jgi:DnaB helicase-like protein/AAA domain-containing protein
VKSNAKPPIPLPAADAPLPQSPESERAFLGAILLGAEAKHLERLEASDFFTPQYATVLRTMKEVLAAGGDPGDPVVLWEHLAGNGQIASVGGAAFISSLSDGLPKTANAETYAQAVKVKAIVRQKLYQLDALRERLYGANGNALEVLGELSILSAPIGIEVGQKRILAFKNGAEMESHVDQDVDWLVRGLLGVGVLTEIVAKVKAGKTTWILKLIANMLAGKPFLGLPTRRTPVVYLTEQPPASFREAMKSAGLFGQQDFIVLSLFDVFSIPWPELVPIVVQECKQRGASLLVVDTFGKFAKFEGEAENNSGDGLKAMFPLEAAVAEGLAVLISRHGRKSGGDVGDTGRGSSAITGVVDISLSLTRMEGNAPKNRRLLQSVGRFKDSPTDLLMELTDEDYVALGEQKETAIRDAKSSIFRVAPEAEADALTLKELAEAAKVSRQTAQRAVDELYREGSLKRIGKGKKGDAFRYFVPEEIRFCPTTHIDGQNKQKNESDEVWALEPGNE